MTAPANRYGPTRDEVETWLVARNAPKYRTDQIWDVLYRQRRPLDTATNIPEALRQEFATAFPLGLATVNERRGDGDTTIKWLFQTRDTLQIETVLMLSSARATVCVSSQAGCAMGCTFCATGQAGFDRHLDVGEIVEQVARSTHSTTQRVTNVVFMGMGEPLANYEPTWAAVERIHDDFGISARRITISTVGIVPGMRRLASEALPVTLAVSLHAPNDELRSSMIPINDRYPLHQVIDAAGECAASHGRRVTFEYACVDEVNDQPVHARELGELLAPLGPLGTHVNLIPLNPTRAFTGGPPSRDRIEFFAARLREHGITATIRRNRGTDIDAACGQLRERALHDPTRPSARLHQ